MNLGFLSTLVIGLAVIIGLFGLSMNFWSDNLMLSWLLIGISWIICGVGWIIHGIYLKNK